ncbi:MAG: ankyrin repeat domain-containing protein [Bryobacteraceae bacterium]
MKLALPLIAGLAFGADSTLFDTIRAGDIAALKSALQNGVDANAADTRGATALHYAALYSTTQAMALLIEHKAKPDAANRAGVTPLMTAIGDLAKVRLLVEKGADINAKSAAGNTPIGLAAALDAGSPVVEFLLSHGAKADAATLRNAVSRHNLELTRLLLSAGVVPDRRAVFPASASGNAELLRMVLKGLKDSATPAAEPRRTALMNAAYHGPLESVRLLLEHGEDIEAKDTRGRTALMYAAGSDESSVAVAQLLLKRGADASVKDVRGDTALDFARLRGGADMIRALGGEPAQTANEAPGHESLPPVRVALERALRVLDVAGPAFFKANACISCHNQSIPQMAAEKTRPAGVSGSPEVAKVQVKSVLATWGGEIDRMWQTSCGVGGGRVATMTYGLLGLAAEKQPATPAIDLVTHCLAKAQAPDGSWWIEDPRQPLGKNAIKFTGLAIRALQLYGLPGLKAEFAERIARGRKFLETANPRDTQGWAFQVLGMKWAGSDPALIGKAAARLAGLQHNDGGWAQRASMKSDAYATGQALWALHEGAGLAVSHAGWRRGAEYLRATQKADGSWHVRSRGFGFQPYRETGFPHGHDQWISSAATGFAVIALAPLIEPVNETAAR